MTPGTIWKFAMVATVLCALLTGIQYDAGQYFFAVWNALLTGFGLGLTVWTVSLDIQQARLEERRAAEPWYER